MTISRRQWCSGTLSIVLLLIFDKNLVNGKQCPPPAVPLYARVSVSSEGRGPGTTATYSCDEGYELFGSSSRSCHATGKWGEDLPYCAVNVAYGKPSNQSSTIKGGHSKNANDGDHTTLHENKYCTETKVENSPWWQVDLLRPYEIRTVRILTRGCCGHQALHDLEVRVGNSSTVQGNRLCSWFPGTLGDGITKDFQCAYPIIGRYVYVQMVGVDGALSLCEVMVFTTQEFSAERCAQQLETLQMTTFNRTCYEFQAQKGGSFKDAHDYCQARGGLVAHGMSNITHNFLSSELDRLKDQMKSKLVWLGARRDPGLRSKTWKWINNDTVLDYMWAEDQPNNYNGQQNCVVLDGGRKWKWNDVTCDLDYLPWICQYSPSNCGSPDRQENSTVVEKNFRLGQHIHYKCPVGNVLLGDSKRLCQSDGFWSGSAPSCKYVDCLPLSGIKNGIVILPDSRTTYNATARYVCDTNYTVVGNGTRVCLGNGTWNGTAPKCKFNQCPHLPVPASSTVDVTGYTAGSKVVYKCDKGHRLIGDQTRKCELGGKWTGEDPVCKFVNCEEPPKISNGKFTLVDGTTYYLSKVTYECAKNYTLDGNKERECQEGGLWSGKNPMCKLISCGVPDTPSGSFTMGDSHTVHSNITYFCEPGYRIVGQTNRTCGANGNWTGSASTCKYIDCGRVPTILRGEVQYSNGTTHLGSILRYSCSPGYRLVGIGIRQCKDDGKWSSGKPKCQEIRCVPPEVPRNATVVYGGNDRTSADSFKTGSTVQYRCVPGHQVQGESLRTCDHSGVWSGQPPACVYIDCGFPEAVGHGHWLLPANTTHYGSSVEYKCDPNFELSGPPRRLCLENRTWSGSEPKCGVVSCREPEKKDAKTLLSGTTYTVDAKVTYSCHYGYKLIGKATRICRGTGKWSGITPYCNLVDCDRPSVISNGRGFLINGTTTYNSIVEYQCLPDFHMVGEPVRNCLASGDWSGEEPKCTDAGPMDFLEEGNNLDGTNADLQTGDSGFGMSKTVGIAVAVGAGILLILIITVAVICMRAKKGKTVKNTENVEVNRPDDKDTATVMSYAQLSLEAEQSNNNLHNNGAIRHNPNGLVTFSSNPQQHQPIYANVTVNGQSVNRNNAVNGHGNRPTSLGVIQSQNV